MSNFPQTSSLCMRNFAPFTSMQRWRIVHAIATWPVLVEHMIPPTDDVFGCRPNCASSVVAIVVARICKVAGLLSLPPDTGDDLLPRVVSMRSAEMVSRTFDHTMQSQSRNVHKVCLGCRCSVPREQAHSSIIAGPIPAIWCGLDSSALGIMWIPSTFHSRTPVKRQNL